MKLLRYMAVAGILIFSIVVVVVACSGNAPDNACVGKPKGSTCWQELQSHAGCYVWNNWTTRINAQVIQENPELKPILESEYMTWEELLLDQYVTWDGECHQQKATGSGTLTVWFSQNQPMFSRQGSFEAGKSHGPFIEHSAGGRILEGTFVAGAKSGHWTIRQPNEWTANGTFVNDERVGEWRTQYQDDSRVIATYLNGELHGISKMYSANGTVIETPFVNGKIHGTEVRRDGMGDYGVVVETAYVNGKKHGTMEARIGGELVRKEIWSNGELVESTEQ